jgi:hypothetical protein
MPDDTEPKLCTTEISLLRHLHATWLRCTESPKERRTAGRLIYHGLVVKRADNSLCLTDAGKRILLEHEERQRGPGKN